MKNNKSEENDIEETKRNKYNLKITLEKKKQIFIYKLFFAYAIYMMYTVHVRINRYGKIHNKI